MKILNNNQLEIIQVEKSLLTSALTLFSSIKCEKSDLLLLQDTLSQLEEIFLIVISGEYNSGKSAFINTLLGDSYLKIGITPTTDAITILTFGKEVKETAPKLGRKTIEIPSAILKEVRIVDTPGTNAILREHESLTTDFIPRADIVIFVTSVDRPFTESERKFLEKIKNWGKKIIFIINKIDIVEGNSDLDEVVGFVSKNAEKLLEYSPVIFPLSAKESLIKIKQGSPDMLFKDIQNYILNTLDQGEKIQIKLNNPLKILTNLTSKYTAFNTSNLALISDDKLLLEDINNQLNLFKEDSLRHYNFRYADIDNLLLEFEKRGLSYFEDTFRLGRIFDLVNKERIQKEYKEVVVTNLAQQIDDKVDGLIQWLVDENYQQWEIVNNKINQRMTSFKKRILHDPQSKEIQFERKKIIASVKREAQRVIEKFNRESEAEQIADDAQMAVAASAAIEVGALGLGALVTILATTASADLTGILLAGLTATLGFFIIPVKKKQAKRLFSENISKIREQLSTSLLKEVNHHLDVIIDNIESTVDPYKRFVNSENTKLHEIQDQFNDIEKNIHHIKFEIDKITK